ncbi:toll/interleukin-1 receptor domain-containing protein [Microbacterium sp. Mu-80]|uniref:Toll/interleukin-1 receptor domain-containing protein n=1 Tax=Microbacterium bandirmense TaxID=3122050 RepID=A0ABU8L9E3_9MICO
MADHRYSAFISYSHSADGAFAPALQSGMQQLGRSWRQRRAMEVFRDETGLAVDPNLWGAITTALDSSEWFVLLASPQAAASHWVGQEIEHCVATKGADRILIVLTEGTLSWDDAAEDFSADSDAVHPALRGLLTTAPTIFDLSWARQETDLTLDNVRFRTDIARIVAMIREEPLQQVAEHDARARRRTKAIVRSTLGVLAAATAVAVIAAVAAGVNWRQASVEQSAAEHEAQVALAREFAAESRSAEDPRAALALAVEAYSLAPAAEHRGALLAAISGTGSELVEVPELLPEGRQSADITSSSSTTDGGGRVTLATATGSIAVDLATGGEWMLPGRAHYLAPDGEHAVGADGTVFALGDEGRADPVATIPALGTEPSFTAAGDLLAYRHEGSAGARLIVVDIAGEKVRSVAVPLGSDCAGCSGDASAIAIAPDGSMVAVRIAPAWAETPIRARLSSYAIGGDRLTELASADVAGTGMVRFTDDSSALWARDDGAVLVLAPGTLEPVGEAMSISRAGPLEYAHDALALAPADGCRLPGVVLPPTMATVAELPADLEYTEGGCYDAAQGGSPRWLLGGSWVRTSAGTWPTEAERLLDIACDALGGTVSREDLTEFAAIGHSPTGCSQNTEES